MYMLSHVCAYRASGDIFPQLCSKPRAAGREAPPGGLSFETVASEPAEKTQATPKKKTQVTPKKKTQVTPLPYRALGWVWSGWLPDNPVTSAFSQAHFLQLRCCHSPRRLRIAKSVTVRRLTTILPSLRTCMGSVVRSHLQKADGKSLRLPTSCRLPKS